MKIAIVLAARWWRFSLNLEDIGAAFEALGHEVVLFCRGNDGGECRLPLVVTTPDEEARPEFWKGFDFALCFTYFREPATHRALRAAGVFNVVRSDSDGEISFRVFPGPAFRRLVHPATGPLDAIRRLRHFWNCWRVHYRAFDREVLATLDACDAVLMETATARRNFEKFLRYYRRPGDRIEVVSHPVADLFLATPPAPDPGPHIYCAGRWSDDQKNAPLALRALREILARRDDVRLTIGGAEAATAFAPLASHPRVEILGKISHAAVVDKMDASRILFSSSRWEGQPISGLEMLSRGRTIVATPVPGFCDLVGNGRFGTISARHSAAALTRATLHELILWDRGIRNPTEIAHHWQPRLRHSTIAEQILAVRGTAA